MLSNIYIVNQIRHHCSKHLGARSYRMLPCLSNKLLSELFNHVVYTSDALNAQRLSPVPSPVSRQSSIGVVKMPAQPFGSSGAHSLFKNGCTFSQEHICYAYRITINTNTQH